MGGTVVNQMQQILNNNNSSGLGWVFTGLILAGLTPQQAQDEIQGNLDSGTLKIFGELAKTSIGRLCLGGNHPSYTNTKYQYQFSKYLQQINSPFWEWGMGNGRKIWLINHQASRLDLN
ncbi:hypothetical protein LYNGBM3L_23820 [Moorena producens 3L]|uniref:Uncharacterized protein n=2 Tax=Coleofasciculaceae TaxID=1892251 RepID=F4XNA9_9CYAN|nr:hypothetical protein LYNGBM3L_23820 [Moorena producens 3L]OLT65123.1 hypothetical protein BI334_08805 [Moorena producens 3L]